MAKGPLKVRDIYSVLPFDNSLVLVELTGSQVN
ncbi:5'-nucleotidase C-terminal domain-containing protein [Thermosediminibacter litoriperuensis]